MTKFIRKNLVVIAGIVIPVVLFAFLSVAMIIIKNTTPPPMYDFLYLESKAYIPEIKINNKKLKITYWSTNTQKPEIKLMRYNVHTNSTQELKLNFSAPTTNQQNTISQEIYKFSDFSVIENVKSPDGYTFTYNYGLGFPKSDFQSHYFISKNGKNVFIPAEKSTVIRFVGWVVPKE